MDRVTGVFFLLGLSVLPGCIATHPRSGDPALDPVAAAAIGSLLGAPPGGRVSRPVDGVMGALGAPGNTGSAPGMVGSGTAYTDVQIEQLLARSLGRDFAGYHWLPNHPDPARATEAIGIIYPPLEGSAGNFSIEVGHFRRSGADFVLSGKVQNLFGTQPRDTRFLPDRIELTSTMPRPGDARCCPSGQTRWSIQRGSLLATRLR